MFTLPIRIGLGGFSAFTTSPSELKMRAGTFTMNLCSLGSPEIWQPGSPIIPYATNWNDTHTTPFPFSWNPMSCLDLTLRKTSSKR